MQVEQSTLSKIAGKEVGWSFSDQEEAAIIDMRMGMEKNFLFGRRSVFFDQKKNQNVYFTGGIWDQAAREYRLDLETMSENDLITLCSKAFTGNNGSRRKILIAGTALMEALSRLQTTKIRTAEQTRVKWGIEFREIVSNFGSLYVVPRFSTSADTRPTDSSSTPTISPNMCMCRSRPRNLTSVLRASGIPMR